jgi:hypothetical protein
MAAYQYDKPKPFETLDEYLWRHHAHPDDPNRIELSEEELQEYDRTEEFLDGAFLIVPQPPQDESGLAEDASPTQDP